MRSTVTRTLTALLAGTLTVLLATPRPACAADPAPASRSASGPGPRHGHAGPDVGRLTLATPGGVSMPFELRGNHINVRGRIGDSDSLWMVLDTGASGNVINASVADRLGLPTTEGAQATGAGGTVAAGVVAGVTVKLPGVTLDGAPMVAIGLDALVAQSGRPMDAIIGHPLLSRCVVRVDYAAGVLTILDADTFTYSGKGAVIPLTFEHRLPYVTARITLPGRAAVEGRFVIDSGSSQALILSAPFVAKQRALETVPRTIQGRGRGVGGQVQNPIGRIAALELGGQRIERPIATLRTSEVGTISAAGTAGNIGGDILRRFTVTFDYPRKRMILEPNAHFGRPLEADMSGLGLKMGPPDSRALEVEWLQPGSAAVEAGVRAGDLIESVDGTKAIELGIPGLREMFRRDGEVHRLALRRGETRVEVRLTTRRMI